MFTGLVEGTGVIRRVQSQTGGEHCVTVESASRLEGTQIGDSIAVDGVCLTAIRVDGRAFDAQVSHETLTKSTIGSRVAGDWVNLERALRLGDRLGGHLVSGHVDGRGRIASVTRRGEATDVVIALPDGLLDCVVDKGSIALDGVSLTVNAIRGADLRVTLVPHTLAATTLGKRWRPGVEVNVEVDMIGKYIVNLAQRGRLTPAGGLSMDTLKEHGFA